MSLTGRLRAFEPEPQWGISPLVPVIDAIDRQEAQVKFNINYAELEIRLAQLLFEETLASKRNT